MLPCIELRIRVFLLAQQSTFSEMKLLIDGLIVLLMSKQYNEYGGSYA
jgi:hypothetical protein